MHICVCTYDIYLVLGTAGSMDTYVQRERQRHPVRERETEKERDREKDTKRETERERAGQRQRQTETEILRNWLRKLHWMTSSKICRTA